MSKTKPDQSFWKLWNLSFGFFGVQIAYALQRLIECSRVPTSHVSLPQSEPILTR